MVAAGLLKRSGRRGETVAVVILTAIDVTIAVGTGRGFFGHNFASSPPATCPARTAFECTTHYM